MDVDQILATVFGIFLFGILGLMYQGTNNTQECKLKALEKGISAIEIQAICK